MELSYRSSQRLRTSTQVTPGGAPIPKIISGSSQSQFKIQKTVLNESTVIVPDTQDQTAKPKSDQSESVISDSDEESSEHQTRLSRMSQERFQNLNPNWQILENSSRNFSEMSVFRGVSQTDLWKVFPGKLIQFFLQISISGV